MFYKQYEDKKLKNVLVMCDCGCSGFKFEILDDEIFISVLSSQFYERQESRIKENIKHFTKKLLRKDTYVADIIVKADELKEVIKTLERFKFTKGEGIKHKNDSHLAIYPIEFNDKIEEYELLIQYDGSLLDIARNKVFRGSEICLNEDEWKTLLNYLKRKVFLCMTTE